MNLLELPSPACELHRKEVSSFANGRSKTSVNQTESTMNSKRDFLRSCWALSLAISRPGLAIMMSSLEENDSVQSHEPPSATEQSSRSDAAKFVSIETLTRSFLDRAGVTAAQLAISRNGVLQFCRAYATKPPSGFSPVDTQSLFRIASCSKMFTCAAIDALHSRGRLGMSLKVFPFLGIHSPAISKDRPDPRIDEITVQHLVDHAGGWNNHDSVQAKDGTRIPGTGWDPVFSVRKIALDLRLSKPPSKLDIARYMYGKPLQFVPGTQDYGSTYQKSYSNFGYVLLGLVIETATGESFIDFLRTGLGSGDTSDVYLSHLLGPRNPREVWYLDPGYGPTALDPRSSALAPSAYGGEGFLPELMDSAGGLMTNAATLAQFASRHAVWGLGNRAPGTERSGGMAGSASYTYSRPNGIDCAFIWNTRNFLGGSKMQDDFISSLRSLLDQL
jgi:CubicO group peptidase (beta-lactamase class C family)